MKFRFIAMTVSAALFLGLQFGSSVASAAPAAKPPRPPAGWALTYAHNFETQRGSGWNVSQASGPGASARNVTYSPSFGAALYVGGPGQAIALQSDASLIVPGTFEQADVYLPGAKGEIANFPAFWSLSLSAQSQSSPAYGEIDLMEGLRGGPCAATKYKGDSTPGLCDYDLSQFTGWHTYSQLWSGGKVTFWYDGVNMGTRAEPVNTPESVIVQNLTYDPGFCPSCYGPSLWPDAVKIKGIRIWSEK